MESRNLSVRWEFQEMAAWEWAVRCFGVAHCTNRGVRTIRFIEEAIELCQAMGISKEQVHKAVEVVYSRPKGEFSQEVGGVEMTLSVLCTSLGVSRNALFEKELLRCLEKSPADFAKRNAEKLALGLTGLDPTRGYPQGGEFKEFKPNPAGYHDGGFVKGGD